MPDNETGRIILQSYAHVHATHVPKLAAHAATNTV